MRTGDAVRIRGRPGIYLVVATLTVTDETWVAVSDLETERYVGEFPADRMEPLPEVTRKEFWAYETVRRSGATNMFDVRTVSLLSGLSIVTIRRIMEIYGDLMTRYGKPVDR